MATSSLPADQASDAEWARRLEAAIGTDRLSLAYQPKLLLGSGEIGGVEALSRWDDPRLGSIPAAAFVPLAERAGLIDPLTDWMLGAALAQWARWRDSGSIVRLACNVSAISLGALDLPDRIERMCERGGVPNEMLTIEVTESATQNIVSLLDTLTRFRLKGFGVALDDFGTGYSSLLQLRQLPYSEIKIDRSFVTDIATSQESRLIVKAIVDLAHAMRLRATAEGVEDAAMLAVLGEIGCDEAQGYFISRALDGDSLGEWLSRRAASRS